MCVCVCVCVCVYACKGPYLQLVCAVAQFALEPLALSEAGHDLLHLALQLLPLVLRLRLGLLHSLQLDGQLLVGTILALLVLLQVSLELQDGNRSHTHTCRKHTAGCYNVGASKPQRNLNAKGSSVYKKGTCTKSYNLHTSRKH